MHGRGQWFRVRRHRPHDAHGAAELDQRRSAQLRHDQRRSRAARLLDPRSTVSRSGPADHDSASAATRGRPAILRAPATCHCHLPRYPSPGDGRGRLAMGGAMAGGGGREVHAVTAVPTSGTESHGPGPTGDGRRATGTAMGARGRRRGGGVTQRRLERMLVRLEKALKCVRRRRRALRRSVRTRAVWLRRGDRRARSEEQPALHAATSPSTSPSSRTIPRSAPGDVCPPPERMHAERESS